MIITKAPQILTAQNAKNLEIGTEESYQKNSIPPSSVFADKNVRTISKRDDGCARTRLRPNKKREMVCYNIIRN